MEGKLCFFPCLITNKMEGKLCFVKNGFAHIITLRMWRKGYNVDPKGEPTYPGLEEAIVIEPGNSIIIDAAELDELWLQMQGLCEGVSLDIKYRVYIGDRANHSGTLEAAEFLANAGILLFTAPNNDQLQKRFVTRDPLIRELELRRSAATTCCLTGFLSCLRTKKQRVKEMEEVINSILDGGAAPRAVDSCVDENVGVNKDTRPMTAGTCEHTHKGCSATLLRMFLQKKGTNCHLSCKDPHECLALHIGVTENRIASGVKLNDQIEQKKGTNSYCMLGAKKHCTKVMDEKENSIMGDGSTSTANHNGGHCDTSGSEVNLPTATSTCDVAVEERT